MAAVAICKATVLKSKKKCTHSARNGTEYCGYHKKFVVSPQDSCSSSVTPPPPPSPVTPAEDSPVTPPPPPPSPVPECAICLTNITKKMVRTGCNHTFHSKCLKKWQKRRNTCPCCRESLSPVQPNVKNNRMDVIRRYYDNNEIVLRAYRSSVLINNVEVVSVHVQFE